MIVFPAVDIRGGKCVRLSQGLAARQTVYSEDPVSVAAGWVQLGASWLHVIDLDGAFQGVPVNLKLVEAICSGVSVPVQLGGGIRDLQTARAYVQAGVARLIIGTLALEDSSALERLCREFPGRIAVSLDAVDGQLKSKGWVEDSGLRLSDLLPRLEAYGVACVIYTDISRDGMQSGINLPGVERVVQGTRLPVIAAGGVSTLEDIQQLYPLHDQGLAGVITGKAIYDGTLNFKGALDWIATQEG